MSSHSDALEAVELVLNRGGEADDVLREVVAVLHERLGRYLRISFVEADGLVPGPTMGAETKTTVFPIAYQGRRVADLEAGGELTRRRSRAGGTRRDPAVAVCPRRLGHERRGLEPVNDL